MSEKRHSRKYDSTGRQEQAARTRAHVIAVAGRLFAAKGYAATSMRAVAAGAEVSLETVVSTGRKADLLLAAFAAQFAGDPDALSLRSLSPPADPTRPLVLDAVVGDLVGQIVPRVADSMGIWRALRVAAEQDAAVAAARRDQARHRRADIVTHIRALEQAGLVARRTPAERRALADSLGLVLSHDSYDQLVVVCGWRPAAYRRWCAATLVALLRAGWR
ncbi:MAG: TetR family transcriptional regulator [Tetrasphaera sp.]